MNIRKLWEESRWKFYLLLPVIGVVLFFRFYEEWQLTQAKKAIKKANVKNKELRTKIQKNKDKILEKRTEIKVRQEVINKRKSEDVPLDWHKNFKR